ncbi:agamous-like MADS-box protein AGL29 [Gastrolobium bilobum]|uniref:agamous-like MADS-box protein AGL29 n=1 Tax=Gastrolobium bilobum TaxID=150636 RepID=UPI002AAFA6BA|nr:agamous-like MADS-box protein AGL29 [Gastrolobium bilobum]
MEGKKTKGKQKREIKKIESEKDLLVTFTKRKTGIHKKATELKTLSGANIDILMFSPTGKSFSYGDPSFESMTRSSSDEEHSSEGGTYQKLEEDHNNLDIDELNLKNDSLQDQTYVAKAREKELKGLLKKKNMRDLSIEQNNEMVPYFEELENKLKNGLSIMHAEVASHDQMISGGNSYPTNASGSNISEVPFGANDEAYGTNPFLDDPNGIIGRSNSHALSFGGSGYENVGGSDPYLYNPSDENGGFPFPPFNGSGHGHF